MAACAAFTSAPSLRTESPVTSVAECVIVNMSLVQEHLAKIMSSILCEEMSDGNPAMVRGTQCTLGYGVV